MFTVPKTTSNACDVNVEDVENMKTTIIIIDLNILIWISLFVIWVKRRGNGNFGVYLLCGVLFPLAAIYPKKNPFVDRSLALCFLTDHASEPKLNTKQHIKTYLKKTKSYRIIFPNLILLPGEWVLL